MSNFDSLRRDPLPEFLPPRPGGSPLHAALMWIVIILSVGIIAADNFRAPFSAGAAATGSELARENPNVGLELASKYVVGASKIPNAKPEQLPKLVSRLDSLATSQADKLRLAIVAGQVQGAAAANKRIESISDPRLKRDADDLLRIYKTGPASLAGADHQRLIDNYGWFGRLALAYGAPKDSPAEKAAIAPAVRTLAAMGGTIALLLLAFIAGLVLCLTAIVRLMLGKVRLAFNRPVTMAAPLLEAFALYVLLIAVVGIAFRKWQGPVGAAGALLHVAIIISIALLPILWPMLRGMPGAEYRRAIGWHAGRGVLHEMGVGILAYIGGLPILALGFMATAVLSNSTGLQPMPHPIIHEIGKSTRVTIELFLLASVYAPIAEETLFRGVLFAHLRGGFGWLISATIVSLIFAALHPQGIAAIPALFSIAFVFAAIREWRGSILPSMTAHALNNALVLMLLTVCLS